MRIVIGAADILMMKSGSRIIKNLPIIICKECLLPRLSIKGKSVEGQHTGIKHIMINCRKQ